MSKAQFPTGWNAAAQALWAHAAQGHSTDGDQAIQLLITQLNTYAPADKPEVLVMQLTYYLFLRRDYGAAVTVLESHYPHSDNPEVWLNLAVCYGRAARHADAVRVAERVVQKRPQDVVAYDVLTVSYQRLGQYAAASAAGTEALRLKDARAQPTMPQWQLPTIAPSEFAQRAGKKAVIAFSLWGADVRYLRGALRNLLLAPDLYPDWTLRFYVDETVPQDMRALMTELGAECIMQANGQSLRQKLCWRFQVANDAQVGYFLVRDVDSVFSVREVNAVQQWRASERWFHVIRDWWSHTDLILAGMWGGVAGVLPNLQLLLQDYQPNAVETPNVDQWFLRDHVWAYVRQSLMTHDRYFAMPDTIRLDECPRHIGQNDAVVTDQARWLRAWIERVPCLAG